MTDFMLETRGLTKEFVGFVAVNDVDLKVRRGTIHCLIGPNGAGKSTLFNLVTRFLSPTSGQVLFEGHNITDAKPEEIAGMGIARSFQISSVFTNLTAQQNVRIAMQKRLGAWFDFWRSERCLEELNEEVDELLEVVGLSEFKTRCAADLAYGHKRALELATTLALEPKMMLLDEPMAGLGREDVGRIVELIRRVAQNRTVLMVEHNLSAVALLSDTITVLARGRVLAEGPYSEVSRNEEVRAVYMGKSHG